MSRLAVSVLFTALVLGPVAGTVAVVLAQTPGITVSPASGAPGTLITVTGANFGATETGISVTYDGGTVVSGVTAATGAWTGTFNIPASAAGAHNVAAARPTPPGGNIGPISFTVISAISINRTTTNTGTNLTVTGAGFGANETGISVAYDGTTVALPSASSLGGWTANFTVPPSPGGAHTVKAGSAKEVALLVNPSISLNRSAGPPGTSLTVTGGGFAASEPSITVTYDGATVASGITANAQGSWSAAFAVPTSSTGSHSIRAFGASTPSGNVSDIPFSVGPAISANRTSGAPGTSLTVTGAGFAASEPGISVTYDGASVASGITANALGTWSATFTVPASPAGSHTIRASGAGTAVGGAADLTFLISPAIATARSSGAPGTSMNVTGAGFGANEPGISIAYGGATVASGVAANAQGTWSATFTVPASPAGSHTIRASGSAASSVADVSFVTGAAISLSRTSGAPGTPMTVTGAGFGANEPGITVTYDGATVASGGAANAQGAWSATFTVPASSMGSHSIRAFGASTPSGNVSDTPFSVGPAISVSRTSGAPGTSLTVTGAGFGADEPGVTVSYDGGLVASGIMANAQGTWSAAFTVPASSAGSHTIKASGTAASSVADVSFVIGAAISLSRTSGAPGTLLTVTGAGFGANEPGINITYGGATVASGIAANAQGTLSATFAVPASPAGSHTVRASGTAASSVADVIFVTGPAISLSRTSGTPGTPMTVTGAGFGANEPGITVTFDGATAASGVAANTQGTWSATFTVPNSPSGNHSVRASGTVTQASTVSEVTFITGSAVSINRTSGAPGTSLTVTGSGFASSEPGIIVTYDEVPVTTSITANASGAWSATLTVPASPGGAHSIAAYGSSTQPTGVAQLTFIVGPGLSVSPPGAAPGRSITVTGGGFSPNESGISASYDGTTVASGITANAQGSWSATFILPPSGAGFHVVRASSPLTSAPSLPELAFLTGPGISANQAGGAPGTAVTVTGAGFTANEQGVTVTYDGAPVASGAVANAQGAWSLTFIIPTSPSGPHGIGAFGATTQTAAIPNQNFVVGPGLSVSQSSGPPGTAVTVIGGGSIANESGITVTYDGAVLASGITADAQGSWRTSFTVPPSPAGAHTLRVHASATQAVAALELSFNVTPTLSITPGSGHVGIKLDIAGLGFSPNSPLSLTYGDVEISERPVITDASGSFRLSVPAPRSKAGATLIKTADGRRNESHATFSMESTAPRVPNPLSPKGGARVSLLGGATPTLKWGDALDPSGVTYILQMDTDPNFLHPLLEKADLANPGYMLTESEALPRGRYYWRIKAVDGASNESPWSSPVALKSGLMALWTLVVIIAVGVALAGSATGLSLAYLRRRRQAVVKVQGLAIPPVVPGYYRELEPEEPARAPGRFLRRGAILALPGPARRSRGVPPEVQARLKILGDFARSLPLVQVGYDVEWLIELAKSAEGSSASDDVPEQLLQGQLSLRYEPAWETHPLYLELRNVLEGHAILQGLDGFVRAVDQCVLEATQLLRDIYQDVAGEVPTEAVKEEGWRFIFSVYVDALGWFRGRLLRDPSEREYLAESGASEEAGASLSLVREDGNTYAGGLLRGLDQEEALQAREAHLRLRRTYRHNERANALVGMITQLEVQRELLLSTLQQLSVLGEAR